MTRSITLAEATREALAEEMARDDRVWALGEDVAYGGIFGQYTGLAERFGTERLLSTPISEAMIMSVGLGAALAGTRPVIEMRIADFALCGWDELINQIAKLRYMFGGQARVPVVVRMPHGMYRSSAAQHSQCLEAWLVHMPGLVVLAPATPADAKGLLKSAIRCDDPVVIFEPKNHWQTKGDVPAPDAGDYLVPIGRATTVRAGRDVTLVTWSSGLYPSLEAVASAERQGIDAELIDLRSLWPWDVDAVCASVERTGRLVVAHEAVQVAGFGAEVCCAVTERLGRRLQTSPIRIGAPRAPVPFAPPLEAMLKLTPQKILAALHTDAKAAA